MSIDQLQHGFVALAQQLYSEEETAARRRGFKQRLKASPNFGRPRGRRKFNLAA